MPETEPTPGAPNFAEREFETGKDESFFTENIEGARGTRALVSKTASDAQALTVQVMQNAIVNTDLATKQALRHADIAADRQWNLDEQSNLAAIVAGKLAASPPFMELMAKALGDAVNAGE